MMFMTFVASDVCHIMTFFGYEVCRIMTFVDYDVCNIMLFVAYDIFECVAYRVCRSATKDKYCNSWVQLLVNIVRP